MSLPKFVSCLLVLVLASLSLRAEADKLTLVKKNEVRVGKITKDDRDGLVFEQQGGSFTFPSSDILEVDWDINVEGYREAIASFRRGAFAAAVPNLKEIVESKEMFERVRAVARPYVIYIYAESLFNSGNVADASAAYQKLLATYKNSRYVPFALSSMTEAAIRSKAFDKVPSLLAQLREAEQRQSADCFEGESLLAQGKVKDALPKFANASTGGSVSVRMRALLGQSLSQAALGDMAKSKDFATQVLVLNPSQRQASSAHALIGDAILAESEKLTGAALQTALLDAIVEYMRVKNQYDADARTEVHSLLKAGECFKKLSKLPNRTGDDIERAGALLSRVGDRRFNAFPDYQEKALSHLAEMK